MFRRIVFIFFRNVTEFEDRWTHPANPNQIAEMNTYINPTETQRRLDIFSNVKAATVVQAVKTNLSDSDEEKVKENLPEVFTLSMK
jgi:hypothetical protein